MLLFLSCISLFIDLDIFSFFIKFSISFLKNNTLLSIKYVILVLVNMIILKKNKILYILYIFFY
ncbi:hypothetical protein H8356DRAFT_1635636 [Neocallimastix lanati (nom. inval.)]|nr:hypothetical protein H8356DRAFT_1635636 [Neocallimastix sp. JGI-2020a]